MAISIYTLLQASSYPIPATTSAPDVFSLAIALLAATAWFGFALWALFERSRAIQRAQRIERTAALQANVLDNAPASFLTLNSSGNCVLSARLAGELGLPDRLDNLAQLSRAGREGLDPPTVDVLQMLVDDLENTGEPFITEGVSADGLRRYEIEGKRLSGQKQRSSVYLLWFTDVTKQSAAHAAVEAKMRRQQGRLEMLEQLMSAAPYPVWLRDTTLRLTYVNDAYVRAVEKDSARTVIDQQAELISNSLTGSSRDTAERAVQANEPLCERHYVVIDGQRRAFQITDVPLRDDRGVAGFAFDVTEGEDARNELSRFLDSQSETLDKLSTPVSIYGPDNRLRFYNSAFVKLAELPEDWLSQEPDHSAVLEAMRERRRLPEQADFQAWKRQILARYRELLEPAEDMWHLPDGSTLRVVTQPHPLGGLLILHEDVTDKLDMERSYNTLIEVQRETLDNLHEAVALFGSDGRLKLFNPHYARLWKFDQEMLKTEPHLGELLDKSRDLMADDLIDWPILRESYLSQITSHTVSAGRWHRNDGVALDYAIVPLPDGASLLTYVDVTDSDRIQHALRERNEALETADRLKSEFVANMSYELRTPLNSIIGFTELLDNPRMGALSDRQKQYVAFILDAAEQLRELIDDILDLAVIEAGGMELEVRNVPVDELLDQVEQMTLELARKGKLDLLFTVDEDPGVIQADRRRLTQALYNVVANAIKFTPPGGQVTVSAEEDGEDILFQVEDTGVGILEEDQDRVFDKFNTGDSAASAGVGLGLSLVRSFVELHGGSVDIRSIPNEGTTVICRVPRHQVAPTGPEEGPPALHLVEGTAE